MKRKIIDTLKKYRIRDAKTDEYIVGFMDRDFILPGRCILAIGGLGFIFGILFIVFAMCTFA